MRLGGRCHPRVGQQLLSPALNPTSRVKAEKHPIVSLLGLGKTRQGEQGKRRTRMPRKVKQEGGVCGALGCVWPPGTHQCPRRR